MPNSRFALHGLAPPYFTVCARFLPSNSRFMRLFQAALDACLDGPFFGGLSVHGLHFTVYVPSSFFVFRGGCAWGREETCQKKLFCL